jgi:hypothetical protein
MYVAPETFIEHTAVIPEDMNRNFEIEVAEGWWEKAIMPRGVIGYETNPHTFAQAVVNSTQTSQVAAWIGGTEISDLRVEFNADPTRRYKITLNGLLTADTVASTYGFVGIGLYYGEQPGAGFDTPTYDANEVPMSEVTTIATSAQEGFVLNEPQSVNCFAIHREFSYRKLTVLCVMGWVSGTGNLFMGFGPDARAELLVEDVGAA